MRPAIRYTDHHAGFYLPDGYVATAKDVQEELARIGHTLKPLEIVVVNTRAGSRYGEADYVDSGCCTGYEAPCTYSIAAWASPERTAGAGTLRSLTP